VAAERAGHPPPNGQQFRKFESEPPLTVDPFSFS
jgi:hypothetical protein